MKKTFAILSALGISCGIAFAAQEQSSGTTASSVISSFIVTTAAVLVIVLFFKVWSMANNIKKIQRGINKEDIPLIDEEVLFPMIMRGENDKAKEYLDNAVLSDIGRRIKWYKQQDAITRETCASLEKREPKIKKQLLPYYKAIGHPFPDEHISAEKLRKISQLAGICKRRRESDGIETETETETTEGESN
ncbi:MAG: hypothetical protein E7070_12090 [Bacteroidales bacterium]|nr:hypothetical protein [Bacteroidales bacterium]